MGAPIVDGDSVIYVQYAVRQIPYPATSIASQLYLLKILPDGTTSTVELGTSTEANLFPGSLLPDGNGGVLATWTVVKISSPLEPEPYKAAHLSSAGTILNTYTMPYAPPTTTPGPYGLPLAPSLVLGEGGTAFAGYENNVASFNVASGSANWNYVAGGAITFFGYNAAAGLTLVDGLQNQVGISSSGTTDSLVALPSASSRPNWEGDWVGALPNDGIALASIVTRRMDWGWSIWAAQGGSPAQGAAAAPSPKFPPLAQAQDEAIDHALDDLVARLKNNQKLQDKAQKMVFNKISTSWNVADFIKYLELKGPSGPNFYDGTKSRFCYDVLLGGPQFLCREGLAECSRA